MNWGRLQLIGFSILWILPVAWVALNPGVIPSVSPSLNSLYRFGGVFTHRPSSWPVYYAQAQFAGAGTTWVTLDLGNYSPLNTFGYGPRVQRLMLESTSYQEGQLMRENLARFLARRHGELFPQAAPISAVKFVVAHLPIGSPALVQSVSGWMEMPLEVASAGRAPAVLSSHQLIAQPPPPAKPKPTETLFHAPATFTDADFKKLPDRDKYTNIDLSQSKVTGIGLAELKYCTATVRLVLKGLTLKDSDMKEIVAMPNLKALDISETPVTDAGVKLLAAKAEAFTYLNIAKLNLTDSTALLIKEFRNLLNLDVSETPIARQCLMQLGAWPQLKVLSIRGINFEGDILRSLPANSGLTTLDLSGAKIGDGALLYLRRLPNLTELRMARSDVKDGALPALSSLARLATIDLSEAPVTLAGVQSLGRLASLKQVRWRGRLVPAAEIRAGAPATASARGTGNNGTRTVPQLPVRPPGTVPQNRTPPSTNVPTPATTSP